MFYFVVNGLPHINYSNVINAIFSPSLEKKHPTEQTSPSPKAQFLNTNPWIYVPPIIQSLSGSPETSLSMKPKGNYTVIDFIVIAIWHCAFQPPGSQFLLELHRLSIMALMKSLSVYRGVKLRTDSAPKLNQYEDMTLSVEAEPLLYTIVIW